MKKCILFLTGAILLSFSSFAQQKDMQFWRAYDQRGINVFETGKADSVAFDGLRVRIGGAFTQQFQSISHENSATPFLDDNGVNTNQLMDIGTGFNLATANLNIDVELADGIRLNLITYLSSRHHPETWVKGGYLQFDKLAFLNSQVFDQIMEKVTIKVGHMEVNYGDSHFRRSDNGNAFYNPFVGNYIMDAFATEIGAEVIYQNNGFIGVASMTGGEIQGGITNPGKRKPSFIGKLGYDKTLDNDLRLRMTGSVYTTAGSVNNTLWAGDRAGSRYYLVMVNTLASTSNSLTSGRFSPGMRDNVTAMVLNPFVAYRGLELFGTLEQSKGKASNESVDRTWNQVGIDAVYRFGSTDNYYLAGRYNQVGGEMPDGLEPSISRVQVGGGWFITKNILAKLEYVNQNYQDFAPTDILNGGSFNGIMIEGVIGF
ncbi:hypothetical protein [Cyclobacterium qasimii]|uniref:Phosphate-selective porin O and P n=2 Tax=Cyclobacterium qasimii TaxID=1350429 RepID=S7WFI9_9BACT|nr:hypothetical protein [Cyclobacterium qasimii]EPR65509.1 hypothetical protein ADICYQ_5430 [Cyclobacterium qasimii M12-11B]GEO19628.1 hypothetical protein CQA01_01620 [Cyclobacterium qasimii]